jgi:hypothetical protein
MSQLGVESSRMENLSFRPLFSVSLSFEDFGIEWLGQSKKVRKQFRSVPLSCSVLCSELIVSHDCDILYDDSPSHFHLFVFVCRIEMSIFPSLQTKIDFIENVVILSVGDPAPFTFTSNDDYKSSRNAWIRTRTQTKFPHLTQDELDDLMLLSNTIHTLLKEKLSLSFLSAF